MKPRYEIHGIGLPDVVEEPSEKSSTDRRDLASRALFAATELVSPNRFDTEVGRTIPQTKFADYLSRYQAQLRASTSKMATELLHSFATDPMQTNLRDAFSKLQESGSPTFHDAWGTKLRCLGGQNRAACGGNGPQSDWLPIPKILHPYPNRRMPGAPRTDPHVQDLAFSLKAMPLQSNKA
jgi:hypothetical protein